MTMKKKFNSRHTAGILALALVATNSLSLLAPPISSGSLGIGALAAKGLNYSVVAKADVRADATITLDWSDLKQDGDRTIPKDDELKSKINSTQGNIIELKFSPSVNARKLSGFSSVLSSTGKQFILELPESLEEVDILAFYSCNLVAIKFNNQLKKIGHSAFGGNYNLTSLKFNPNLESIGDSAFSINLRPSKLKTVEFNDKLVSIGKYAFAQQSSLTTVKFGNGLKEIGESAFVRTGLTAVLLQNGVETIGNYAFAYCNISSIALPNSLTSIGDNCFRSNKIKSVSLPSSLTTVGINAFRDNQISEINFGNGNYNVKGSLKAGNGKDFGPDSNEGDNIGDALMGEVKDKIIIPNGMFAENKLESLNLPTNIVAIGNQAFMRNDIKDINIPASVEVIYNEAFLRSYEKFNSDFTAKLNFKGNSKLRKIGCKAFNGACIVGRLSFPSTVDFIGAYSFGYNKITGLSLNGLNAHIRTRAFGNTTLKSVEGLDFKPSGDIKVLSKEMFAEVSRDHSTLRSLKNVSFNYTNPNPGFTGLGNSSFYNQPIRSMKIPAQIVTFGNDVFGTLDPYLENGWYQSTEGHQARDFRVALYRVDKNLDYVTTNNVPDGDTYVFNPVLFELKLKDNSGKNYADYVTNIQIEGTNRKSTIARIDREDARNDVDYNHFKLGDKVTFSLNQSLPSGYRLESPGLKSLENNRYEIALDLRSGAVKEAKYTDDADYKFGYMKTTISLVDSNKPVQPTPQPKPQPTPQPTPQPSPQPTPQPTPQPAPQPTPQPSPQPAPQPSTGGGGGGGGYIVSEPSNNTVIPETPSPSEPTNVGITEDTTPQGTVKLSAFDKLIAKLKKAADKNKLKAIRKKINAKKGLTLEQFAKELVKKKIIKKANKKDTKKYLKGVKTSKWARAYVAGLIKTGALTKKDIKNVKKKVTENNAAKILTKIFIKSKKIKK